MTILLLLRFKNYQHIVPFICHISSIIQILSQSIPNKKIELSFTEWDVDSGTRLSAFFFFGRDVPVRRQSVLVNPSNAETPFCPKHKDTKTFENHLNPVILVFINSSC